MNISLKIASIAIAAQLGACSPSGPSTSSEVQTLKTELAGVKQENQKLIQQLADLKNTPAVRLNAVAQKTAEGDLSSASMLLADLKKAFPAAPESDSGARLVSALAKSLDAKKLEAEKAKQLGLKLLVEKPVFNLDTLRVTVGPASVGNRWTFDRYGDTYHYAVASRGESYVFAAVTIKAEGNVPQLPPLGLYVAKDGALSKLQDFKYRFAQWEDYATFLGNYSDTKNDFEKTAVIPFTIGATFDASLSKQPIFVIAAKEACHERHEARFDQPPVSYRQAGCRLLNPTLSLEVMLGDSEYQVVRVLNKGSL